jgi:hypothetical protein
MKMELLLGVALRDNHVGPPNQSCSKLFVSSSLYAHAVIIQNQWHHINLL